MFPSSSYYEGDGERDVFHHEQRVPHISPAFGEMWESTEAGTTLLGLRVRTSGFRAS
jgi:hypothetical protein